MIPTKISSTFYTLLLLKFWIEKKNMHGLRNTLNIGSEAISSLLKQ